MSDERSDAAHPGAGTPDQGLRGRDLIGLGSLLVGSVVVCTGLGVLLDRGLDTSPAFSLAGVALGIALAGVGFWVRVRTALRG